jgi:hypothetical protein
MARRSLPIAGNVNPRSVWESSTKVLTKDLRRPVARARASEAAADAAAWFDELTSAVAESVPPDRPIACLEHPERRAAFRCYGPQVAIGALRASRADLVLLDGGPGSSLPALCFGRRRRYDGVANSMVKVPLPCVEERRSVE